MNVIDCTVLKVLSSPYEDGKGAWSHGATLKDAKNDLIYKIINRYGR